MSDRQEWFDDNRQRFDAETTAVSTTFSRCKHQDVFRKSATEVQCKCGAGWIDGGKWTIKNGRIVG